MESLGATVVEVRACELSLGGTAKNCRTYVSRAMPRRC
jgi:hypothetical protein